MTQEAEAVGVQETTTAPEGTSQDKKKILEIPTDEKFLEFIKHHAERYRGVCGWDILLDEMTDEEILEMRGPPTTRFKGVNAVSKQVEALHKERERQRIEQKKAAQQEKKVLTEEELEELKAERRFTRQERKANRLLELAKKRSVRAEERAALRAEKKTLKQKELEAKREQREAAREENEAAKPRALSTVRDSADTRQTATNTARKLLRSRQSGNSGDDAAAS